MTHNAHSTLWLPQVQTVLDRLHDLADERDEAIGQRVRSDPAWGTASSQQKATMLQEALLPVSRDAGRFLYVTARSISAKRIVEFGTSFGISTIYFAAALRDIGGGLVIGSELDEGKVAKANQHLAEAGLSEYAEIRSGDAMQTLRDYWWRDRRAFSRRLEGALPGSASSGLAQSHVRLHRSGRRRDPVSRPTCPVFGIRP